MTVGIKENEKRENYESSLIIQQRWSELNILASI
jgi:hypothetical protein